MVVLGARQGIDSTVRAAGGEVRYAGGQRVTDAVTMQAAVQAAGAARMEFEAHLSKVIAQFTSILFEILRLHCHRSVLPDRLAMPCKQVHSMSVR